MSLLRSSCCVLALTLLILAAEVKCDDIDAEDANARVKRQSQIFIQVGFTSDLQQRYTLVVQGVSTGVVANDPNLESVLLTVNETVQYSGSTATVTTVSTNGTMTMFRGVNTFTFLDEKGDVGQFNSFPVTTGPGLLYVQGSSAFFSKAVDFNNQIGDFINQLPEIINPPDPVDILVTNRDRDMGTVSNLVLNIDAPPDGNAAPIDDVIELTGSMAFILSDRQAILYTQENLLLTTGNSISDRFPVTTFSTLEPVTRAGVSGAEFREFNLATPLTRSLSGPGILRVGKLGGVDVAFFSSISSVNQQISSEIVGMQLNFAATDATAEVLAGYPPTLSGERLVMLNGAQSFSYPDATTVRTEGSAVSVFSGSRLLQRFDTGSNPTVSTFLNHQITRMMVTAPMMYSIPEGGATLFYNEGDNEVFVYPSRNQIIGQGINNALETAGITQEVPTAAYSLTANEFGTATLLAQVGDEGRRVVQVAPGTSVFDIGDRNSITYKGGTIEILDSNGGIVRTISGISPLTVNAQGNEYRSNPNNFTTTFGGPGRLYIDPMMDDMPGRRRAFYTGNTFIQNFITNFVRDLPEPRIDIVRNRTSGIVSFQTGGMNLFNLNGAGTVSPDPNTMAGIYFNEQLSIVNAFDIPDNARAVYTASNRLLRVPDPNNPGSFLFSMGIPVGGLFLEFDDSRPTNQIVILDDTVDRTFSFMNGNIYFSERGAIVGRSDAINDPLYRQITNAGSLEASVQDIPGVVRLTVADGRSIISYSGMTPNLLPFGGTYYISSDGNSSIFIANAGFNSRVPGIYSQLNPSTTTYNRTTGVVSVTTAEGDIIGTLRPGITVTQNIDRNDFIRYVNETIIFEPELRQPIMMINRFLVWNGLTLMEFNRGNDDIRLSGPGIFWFEGDTAFYTSDPTTVSRINERIRNVMTTFRQPIISRTPSIFRSKFRTVEGGFPQTITVYEGADVTLRCIIAAGSPPPTVIFQRRIVNTSTNEIEYQTIVDGDNAEITQSGNASILTIRNIMINELDINTINETGRFRCIASNIAGTVRETTTINVLPSQAPAIVSGFVPPLETLQSSNERLISIRAGDANVLPVVRRAIITRGVGALNLEDDGRTIVDTIHIGCKAEGLPKANIAWYELDQTTESDDLTSIDRVMIDDEARNDVNITEPRQGRSILTVDLQPGDVMCRRYICEATNLGGTTRGGVDICPQYYTCENIDELPCSGTCGFGVASRIYSSCNLESSTGGTTVPYAEVPFGLFPLDPVLCGLGRDPCPQITYEFGVEPGSETECSVTCGVGSIMRNIVCQQFVNGILNDTVDESFCAGQYRPSMFVTCADNPPCPFWRTGEFGECSSTCRGGMRMREVMCVQPAFNDTNELILDENNNTILMTVDDALCANGSIGRPLSMIICNDHIDCPIRWRPGPWGVCPTTGDMRGCQVREIVCEEYRVNDYRWPGITINNSVCEALGLPRPHSVRSCQGFVCNFGVWVPDRSQSVCSVTCGRGTIRQNVTCIDPNNGNVLEDGYCDIRLRPADVVPCPLMINCQGVCDFEPAFCPIIKLLGCDHPAYQNLVVSCCQSCPKQATPIPPPITETVVVTVTATPDVVTP